MSTEARTANYLRLRSALIGFQRTPAELNDDERRTVEQQAVQAYAIEERVLAMPEARDVHVPASVVAQVVQGIVERYPDRAEFEADLERNGLDVDTLRRAVERELRVEAVIEHALADRCEVSDDEVAIYYLQHKERFTRPEVRTLRHILITVNDAYPDNSPERARERIEAVKQELADDSSRFEQLARGHSECPSAMEGGRIGKVKRGMLHPELDNVAFAMDCGAISDVVESELGFHLLWCAAVNAGSEVSLDEVSDKIREVLGERKRKVYLREWLKSK